MGWMEFPFRPREPHDYNKLNEYLVPLHVQKVVNSRLVDVLKTESQVEGALSVSNLQLEDGSTTTEKSAYIDVEFDISQ